MTYFKRAILTPITRKTRKQGQKSMNAVTKIKIKSDMKKITLEHHTLEMSFSKAIVENIKSLKEAGEMVHGSLAAPPENLNSITCSHMVVYNSP